jgi:hypothetical protein
MNFVTNFNYVCNLKIDDFKQSMEQRREKI